MTKQKSTMRTLLSSVLALVLCFSMLVGTTFAWFTDTATAGVNTIQSGTLDIVLEYSVDDGNTWEDAEGKSLNFKTADGRISNIYWEPGCTYELPLIRVRNNGNLALKYEIVISGLTGDVELLEAIDFYVNDKVLVDSYHGVLLENEKFSEPMLIKGHMKEEAGNEYQTLKIENISISVFATQMTYENDSYGDQYDKDAQYPSFTDKLEDGPTYDWYFSTIKDDPNAKEFALNTAEDLAGLVALVEGTAVSPLSTNPLGSVDFKDKLIKLNTDIDLYVEDDNGEPVSFDPIGSYRFDQAFKGTFDGQGHTIYNLYQNTWALNNGYYYHDCGLGLFGAVEDATIKNLTIDGANISGESALCGAVAAVAQNTTFENITIMNTNVADYQYYAGGIVGWASGEINIKNCKIDASTTIAAQWGDFDNSIGGLIGGASGSADISVKDSTIACRIDAYNDVTSSYQWYAYRRCGMIIGNTNTTVTDNGRTVASAPQLTCENVTVIYGDWANYTYCEFAGTSWPYVRTQEGVSNSAYSNPRYGHPTDANGNEVVNDTHVHNDGEDHLIVCQFDQLYGGGQGVYGNPTHEGVTVVYNNK